MMTLRRSLGLGALLLAGAATLLMIQWGLGDSEFALGLVLAVVPVPIYVLLVLWLDRLEIEPLRMLGRAFLWGAAGAAFLSLVLNSLFAGVVEGVAGYAVADFAGAVIAAPVVEEVTKGLALLVFFLRHRTEFDNVTDGVVYAGMVGLGFAMTENVLYYGMAAQAGGLEASIQTFVLRGVLSPFAHPLFTAAMGAALGLVRERHWRGVRAGVTILGGIAGAVALHGIWNLSAYLDYFFLAYAAVMVPSFLGILRLTRLSRARQTALLREHLDDYIRAELLDPMDVESLCSLRGRVRASMEAWRRGGARGWWASHRYRQTAFELAFHHARIVRTGAPAPGSDGLAEGYLRELRSLRATFSVRS